MVSNTQKPEKKHTLYLQLSLTLLCPVLINDLTGINPSIWPHCWLDDHFKGAVISFANYVTWACFHRHSVPQPTKEQSQRSERLLFFQNKQWIMPLGTVFLQRMSNHSLFFSQAQAPFWFGIQNTPYNIVIVVITNKGSMFNIFFPGPWRVMTTWLIQPILVYYLKTGIMMYCIFVK